MSQERRAVTEEEIQRWRTMYESEGKALKVIAEEEDRGLQTIKRYLLKSGVKLRQRQMAVSTGERKDMVDRFIAGERIEEIATDRNIQTVWRNLCYGLRDRIWSLTKVDDEGR